MSRFNETSRLWVHLVLLTAGAFCWIPGPLLAAPGDLEALNVSLTGSTVYSTALQPDGKIIIAGDFSSVLGTPRNHIARLNANGTLDEAFDPKPNGVVYAVAVQEDGRLLIGGDFTGLQPNGAANSTARSRIARVHVDGTLDSGFDPHANSTVYSLAIQADGKILMGGFFTTLQPNGIAQSVARQYLARVNADGTLDSGFDPKPGNLVRSVAIQQDGKILFGGAFGTVQPNGAAESTSRSRIARVHADGTLDTGFDPKTDGIVYCLAVQADGKVLLGGLFASLQPNGAAVSTPRSRIARVHADGTLDTGFDPKADKSVYSLAVQTDGKILLGGLFSSLQPNGAPTVTLRNRIARLHANGTLDTAFDPKPNNDVWSVALQPDGKILLGGTFGTLQPNGAGSATTRNRFSRLTNDSATQTLSAPDITQIQWTRGGAGPEISHVTFDLSIDGGGNYTPLGGIATRVGAQWQLTGLALPPNGHLRARGRTKGGYQNGSSGLVESVTAFNTTASLSEIAVEYPTGTDLASGTASVDFGQAGSNGDGTGSTLRSFKIKKLGSHSLAGLGITLAGNDASAYTVTLPPPTTLAVGAETTFTLRFSPNTSGPKTARLLLASNDADETPFEIILTGTGLPSGNAHLSSLILNVGTLSPALSSNALSYTVNVPFGQTSLTVTPTTPQANATIRVNGESVASGTTGNSIPLAQTTTVITIQVTAEDTTTQKTYTLTVTRNPPAPGDLTPLDIQVLGTDVYATAVQPDGKIILVGNFTSILGVPRQYIARLHADGTLDMSFDPKAGGGIVSSVAVQSDGKILLGGFFTTLQPNGAGTSTARPYLARVNADGSLDTDFSPRPNNAVRSIAIQPDGQILIGGDFTALQPNGAAEAITRHRIARLNVDGTLETVFDPKANNTVYSIAVQMDGRILIGGGFDTLQPNGAEAPTSRQNIARVNENGSLDDSFAPEANGMVTGLTMQANGKILVGGTFTAFHPLGAAQSIPRQNMARLHEDGTIDPGFDPKANGTVSSMAVQADGKILLGGAFTALQPNEATDSITRRYIARLNADGTLDSNFDPNVNDTISSVALQADGKILIGGAFTTFRANGAVTDTPRSRFARLENDPALQTLSAPHTAQVSWTLGGTAPEVTDITFELSADGGTNYTRIEGTPTRIGGSGSHWQLEDLILPVGGHLRARARMTGGLYSGSSGVIESVIGFSGLLTPVSEIAVDQPAGVPLDDNTGSIAFAVVSNTSKTFVVRNVGNGKMTGLTLSITEPNASSFILGSLGATTLLPGGSTTFTVSVPTTVQHPVGYQTATLHLTDNDSGGNSFDVPLTYSYLARSNWRMAEFGTPLNTGPAADLADADHDGLTNLVEFATGSYLTPLNANPGQLRRNGSHLEYTYTRLKTAIGECTFDVQWNDDLGDNGGWNTLGVTDAIIQDNSLLETVRAIIPMGAGSRRFVRLQVTAEQDDAE